MSIALQIALAILALAVVGWGIFAGFIGDYAMAAGAVLTLRMLSDYERILDR